MTGTGDLSDAKRALLQKMLGGGAARSADEPVARRSPFAEVPLSVEQSHVWLHAQMAPEQPIYNEPVTIRRRGSFDRGAMTRAFNEVLRRHEALRASFRLTGDNVVQDFAPIAVDLPLADVSHLPSEEREAAANAIAAADALLPFDLSAAPLFRAKVIRLAENEHRLYLTLHHIVFDGATMYRIVVPELATIYEAFARGEAPGLPEPALQFGDYAVWRARQVSGEAVSRQMDYWRRALAGPLPVMQLPSDRPQPAQPSYRGATELFAISPDLTRKLQAVANREGATPYMALLAGFNALLHRYTGQEDLLVGTVADGRRRPELEYVAGYILNSLPLRVRPTPDQPFRTLLAQTRDTLLGALGASDVPFERIVRELAPRREGGRPLFQVLFGTEPPLPGLPEGFDFTHMDVDMALTKFDLFVGIEERGGGYAGRIIYSTDLFDAGTIRRMIGHWKTLLEGAVADPEAPLARLPLLTATERHQMLVAWNDTARPLPAGTLLDFFSAQVARAPDAIAAQYENQSWSYRQLDARSDMLAARLRAAGIRDGMLVGICVERSLDLLAGLLAILKCGAAYLPLDPAFPPERLAAIAEEAKPAALLTETRWLTILPPHDLGVLIDQGSPPADAGPLDKAHAAADDLAYVLYTSGSTGKPKGVEIRHSGLLNVLLAMQAEPGFGPDDVLLAVTTLSFDITAIDLFLPLISGGKVVIAQRDIQRDPAALMRLIAESGATFMQATPATWRAMLDEGWQGSQRLKILCGGEAMTRPFADALMPRCASLWNMYGPTETTICSTGHRVVAGETPVPVGRPIANTTHYVVDGSGNPLPVGVPGELWIGGAGVALGYRNRADLTAERFIESPFVPAERLYRTGDMVRYRDDGAVECLGRTDNQVKVRGFRIELEDVEAHIMRHPDVAVAAARTWRDASGETSLAGYVVMRPGHAFDAAALRLFLGQNLPDYMIPQRFVVLPAMPMTANRKIDRHALPDISAARSDHLAAPPREGPETALAAIWKDVLGVPEIGAQDNFFELGGHSLLAARLVRRIEQNFGIRLPMAAVFNNPALDAMAALLTGSGSKPELSRVVQVRGGIRPALFWLNGGVIFHDLAAALGRDQPFYDVPLEFAPDVTEETAPPLAAIAAEAVAAIRAAQPQGPYHVGGWCDAGILAFETMRQLAASGAETGLLVLAHSANPVHRRKYSNLDIELSKLRLYAREFLRQRPSQMGRFALERMYGIVRRINEPWLPDYQRLPEENKILAQSVAQYDPKPYRGDVALFQPQTRPDIFDHAPGWAGIVQGKFTVADIPGSHLTMFSRPNVQQLADVLMDALARSDLQTRVLQRAAG